MNDYDHDLNNAVSEYQSVHERYLNGLLSIERSQSWISDWAVKGLKLARKNSADTKALRGLIDRLDGKPELSLPELSSALETLSYDHYSDLIAQMESRPEATEAQTTHLKERLESLLVEILHKCEPRVRSMAAKMSDQFRKEPESFKSLFFLSLLRAMHEWRIGSRKKFINYFVAVVRNALVNDVYGQLLIRIPRRNIPDVRRLLYETEKFERAEGRQPTIEELAVPLKLSMKRIRTLKAQIYPPVSLDAPLSEDPNAGTLHDVIPSELALNADVQKVEAAIRSALAKLSAPGQSPQPDDDRLPFEIKQDFGLILLRLPAELVPVVKSRSRPIWQAMLQLMPVGFKDLKQSLEDEKN